MTRRVFVAGVLAGVLVFVWYFMVNGIFGFNSRLTMKRVAEEEVVYETLRDHVTTPGKYVINPQPTERGFPPDEPVFSVLYGGMGHEAAGKHVLASTPFFVILPLIAAWMLSKTSDRVLSSGPLKVTFVAAIGVLLAAWGHVRQFGIGGYPLSDSLLLGLHDVVLWTLIGLVLAWRIRPAAAAR
jgi:hypothetical protein